MGLRRQLLLVSLLLLTLPWAGCQFVREMEGALRKGQEQSLQASAQAIAATLGDDVAHLYPFEGRRDATPDDRANLYAFSTTQPVIVDGYGDGWEDIGRASMGEPGRFAVRYAAQVRGDTLYLLLNVEDEDVVYDNPGLSPEPNGDRLVLRLWYNDRRQDYVLTTAAPGSVRARPANRRERDIDAARIRGFWQDAVSGYTLELEVPLAYTGGRLGFYLVNESRARARTATLGNIEPLDATAPPWLIFTPPDVDALLRPFATAHSRIQLVDNEHWLLAEQRPLPSQGRDQRETFWLLRLLYRSILSNETLEAPPAAAVAGKIAGPEIDQALSGVANNRRYRDSNYASRTTLVAAAPIRDAQGVLGAVVLRQSAETYLSLTDRAFGRLFRYSLLAVGIGVLGLLGFATVLSWRIRALSQAASNAIGDDGRVAQTFTHSNAPDEIGALSRNYGELLARVRHYNEYLHSLSRKLAHELRTPIAVIQSSLDNLEQADTDSERAGYSQRAREGLTRLQHMLTAMSEANRLEESISSNRRELVDLVPLLREVHAAYRDVFTRHRLLLALEPPTALVEGSPELLVQALDKLVENAASFCPEEGEITLALTQRDANWVISVGNEGAPLPPQLRERLFEPMVSARAASTDAVHLGLGLHIVQLIVQFHSGDVAAQDLEDGTAPGRV